MRLDQQLPLALGLRRVLPGWVWTVLSLLLPGLWLLPRWPRRRKPQAVAVSAGSRDPLAAIEVRLQQALARLAPGLSDAGDAELTASLIRSGMEPQAAQRVTKVRSGVRRARYARDAEVNTAALGRELEGLLQLLTPQGEDGRRRWRERAGLTAMFLLLVSPAQLSAQTPPEQLYEAGAYSAAADGFQRRALAAPEVTTNWFNLGDAAWRAGDDAQSLAAWVRAARLSPRDQGVRRALLLVPPGDPWAARNLWVSPVAPAELWLLGLIAWGVGWVGAAWSRGLRGRWLVLIGGGVVLFAGAAALSHWYRRPVAVLAANQVLRLSPHELAPPAGEVARLGTVILGERRGAWVRVVAQGGQEGWIPGQELRPAGDLLAH